MKRRNQELALIGDWVNSTRPPEPDPLWFSDRLENWVANDVTRLEEESSNKDVEEQMNCLPVVGLDGVAVLIGRITPKWRLAEAIVWLRMYSYQIQYSAKLSWNTLFRAVGY